MVINKTDKTDPEKVAELIKVWNKRVIFTETVPISALNKTNTETLFKLILENTPEGPVYYPKDQLTDKPERFLLVKSFVKNSFTV